VKSFLIRFVKFFCLTNKNILLLFGRETDGGLNTQEWKHRKIEEFTFTQQMNVGNKTWNSGCWKRKLKVIATSRKMPFVQYPASQRRAQYILDMRENKAKTPMPTNRMGFFPFEEQLHHHTREAIGLASTGIGAAFFQNPHIRDYLRALQPRHRPIYRLKLIRLIRCVIDTTQSEVCNIVIF